MFITSFPQLISESNARESMVSVKNRELLSELESVHEEQQNLMSKVAEKHCEVSLLNDKILSSREELIMATDDNDQLQLRNTQLQSVSSIRNIIADIFTV